MLFYESCFLSASSTAFARLGISREISLRSCPSTTGGELAKVGGREERGRVRGLEEFFYVHRSYSTQLVTIAIGAATIASVTRRAAGLYLLGSGSAGFHSGRGGAWRGARDRKSVV